MSRWGSTYGKGDGRDSTGTTSMQNLQVITPAVDLRIGDKRQAAVQRLAMENAVPNAVRREPRYSILGLPDEFDIHKGDLLFTMAHRKTGAAGLTTVYNQKGRSPGVFSCFNGMVPDDVPVISSVAMSEFIMGDVNRSGTNQGNVSGAVHGVTNVPCSDPQVQIGDTLIWEWPMSGASTDPNIPNTVGTNSSGRMVATVRAFKPLGESRDSYAVRIRDALMGVPTGFTDFDEKVRALWTAFDQGTPEATIEAIGLVFGRTPEEINRHLADLMGGNGAAAPAGVGAAAAAQGNGGRDRASALAKFVFLKIVQLAHEVDSELKERIVGRATEAPRDGRVGISFRLP